MAGLLDERRGRRGPVKLRPEIVDFIRSPGRVGASWSSRSPTGSGCGCTGAPSSGRAAAVSTRSFWPPVEAAQVDYETLRAHLLEHDRLPDDLAAARFARRGLAGLITWPAAEPMFVAELVGAARPAWTPHPTRESPRWPRATSSCSTPPRHVDSVAGLALTGQGPR